MIYYKTFSLLIFAGGGSASNNKEVSKPTTGFDRVASSPAGFVSADDFKASFAALASNDFDKDYFEQLQKRPAAEKESYESKPGPSYTANRAPAQFTYQNNGHKKGVATEVHDLTEKPPKQRAPKKYKKPESAESGESAEYKEDVSYAYPSAESYYQPSAATPTGKVADYNTGKSSSTVSQNSYTPGYYTKLAQASEPSTDTLSPYDKFSFQPASSDYISAVAPFNKPSSGSESNQPTENVEKALAENKNCKKIDKQIQSKDVKTGRFKRQSMNCFICQDPETKSNFEQCTYTTDSAPKSYYTSATNTYTAAAVAPSEPFRQKRYSEGEGQVDPYDLVKNQKYHSRPKAFDGKHYQPPKETAESNREYKYTPPNYKKEESKKSFSEQKADELIQKGGDNCEKVQREEMSCVVCTSAETGGNYEQCSYSSAPAQQKYAYVREQKFDGPVPDKQPQASHASKAAELAENTKQEAKTEAPRYSSYQSDFHRGRDEPLPLYGARDEEQKGSEKSENQENANSQNKQKENNRGSTRYQIPSHFEYEASSSNKKPGGRGLDPRLYGGDEEEEETEATQNQKKEEKSNKKKDEDEYEFPAIGEYKFKYFPDFLKEESETAESKVVAEPAKKDVEEVLAEFAKKDRSNCQKAEKNGMTCYLCTDKNGLQHEECMYISESVPKQSHVAYHEKQEVQSKPAANSTTQTQPTQAPAASEPAPAASEQMINKIKFKAVTPLHEEEKVAASNKNSNTAKAPKGNKELTTSESRNDEEETGATEKEAVEEKEGAEETKTKGKQKEEDDEKITDVPEPPTPEEFKVGEKEGAFSEETRPVFSKALGVTLPKYMLTKSESEAIFDEFVSSS